MSYEPQRCPHCGEVTKPVAQHAVHAVIIKCGKCDKILKTIWDEEE